MSEGFTGLTRNGGLADHNTLGQLTNLRPLCIFEGGGFIKTENHRSSNHSSKEKGRCRIKVNCLVLFKYAFVSLGTFEK